MRRALFVAAIALAAAAALTLFRLDSAGGDPSRFVVAGRQFVGLGAPTALHVESRSGYDGQYFYRMSRSPVNGAARVDGVRLERPAYRQQRLAYPLIVWLLTLGGRTPRAVMWAMIAVNVVGLAVLAGMGARLAQHVGRSEYWGLVLAAYPGFALTLARDLAEIVSACFAAAALLMVLRGRPLATGVLLSMAVFTRETSLVIAIGLGASWLLSRDREVRSAVAFVLPGLTFVGTQLLGLAVFGRVPVLVSGGALGAPLAGLSHLVRDVTGLHGRQLPVSFEALVLLFSAVAVALTWRALAAPGGVRIAWIAALVLLVLGGPLVWADDWAFMRAGSEFAVLSFVLLLSAPRAALAATGAAHLMAGAFLWPHLVARP